MLLERTSLFELLEVTLALDVTSSSKHDILVSAVDVLLPLSEPCTSLVVLDFLPFVTCRRLRHLRALTDVDDDLLGHNAALDFACLRVLATSTEQTRGFDSEVADLLFATIPHAVEERLL